MIKNHTEFIQYPINFTVDKEVEKGLKVRTTKGRDKKGGRERNAKMPKKQDGDEHIQM